ncbi:YncE family protein [Salinimicrobium terrae]|uniref:YncE family protein n=1 Tax=Salinimicrobium terrae TaxID=470866 RepID=UPI0004905BF2|nr:DUF5074 domain-containing protein [Salinimicrobium terrae]
MKLRRFILLLMFGSFLLNSCSEEDDPIIPEPETGAYSEGLFVLNEGAQAAGTVTYISNDLEVVENEIYQATNDDDLGTFLQSMFFNDDNAYIISNGSNLITVVDRNTFEVVGKVDSDLVVPYYAAVTGGKAYVTNINSFDTSADDFVAVVDLETLEVTHTINLNTAASNILEDDGFVYVQNSSFGTGNTITVINTATNAIVETIEVNDGLTDMDIENAYLYVLSSGSFETVDLTTGEVVSELIFSDEIQGFSKLDVEEGTAYLTLDNAVYSMQVGATEGPVEPIIEYSSNSQWGKMYGFEVENDRIYIGDAGDFSSNGFIQVYNVSGDLLEQIAVGVAPNGFYFNK